MKAITRDQTKNGSGVNIYCFNHQVAKSPVSGAFFVPYYAIAQNYNYNMDAIDAIFKNYEHGKALALFEKLGGSRAILSACKFESDFTKDWLFRELKKLGSNPKLETTSPETKTNPIGKYQAKKYDEYPGEIQALISEKIYLLKSAETVHAALRDNPENISLEERRKMALEILISTSKADILNQKIRYYDANSVLPPEYDLPKVVEHDMASLFRRRNTLRTYLTKIKKGLMKKEKLFLYQQELMEVERKIADESVQNK